MTDRLTMLVLFGSVRRDRQGIGLARLVVERARALGFEAEFADPMEIELPLLDRMYKEHDPGTAPAPMRQLAAMIGRADAVCVVSAEYNHGVPPALKNLLDHFLEEWFHKPAGICCYSTGHFGGLRAAMQLRMTLPELGMPTISSLLPVPRVARAVPADGPPEDWVAPAIDGFLRELAWWAKAARDRRAAAGPPF